MRHKGRAAWLKTGAKSGSRRPGPPLFPAEGPSFDERRHYRSGMEAEGTGCGGVGRLGPLLSWLQDRSTDLPLDDGVPAVAEFLQDFVSVLSVPGNGQLGRDR